MRRTTFRRKLVTTLAAAALVAAPMTMTASVATAQTSGAYVTSTVQEGPRKLTVNVYSPSMNKTIPVEVMTPADNSVPRPTFYLLNGAGGGEDSATWSLRTDADEFFADKNVNVITPIGGMLSYYTDWERDDPELGRHKWTTFITQELPPVIDAALGANGVNAIAGLSTSATSVLNLAIARPGLFKAVGSYSGCAQTSDPLGQAYIRTVVEGRGQADATNMWGPYDGPGWRANDPVLNAEKLRGTAIYVSNGTGLPGHHDVIDAPLVGGNPVTLANQIVVGGIIEAATIPCTVNLQARLASLDIPAHFNWRPTGTHSWGYWEDDLKDSWPMIAQAIGA
ncbi:alpha/beta hydrolase [Hoyosella altamirensis]|uniref:Acyl-CoA:diacylglycerol acyltransferase n=1 Tax=Hoyosella altamirensis TaxID=616997 RepID=A0A839RUB6_9ACTN|nr:alpha/beta hydrolase family protein [Hoyosella altamirensis]MBB3039401.1 S-formylglutathione hydrolase FrmB [Hoyosella altamirensis]